MFWLQFNHALYKGKCKIVCKIMAYNFFIKVLDGKDKKTYLCPPEKWV